MMLVIIFNECRLTSVCHDILTKFFIIRFFINPILLLLLLIIHKKINARDIIDEPGVSR